MSLVERTTIRRPHTTRPSITSLLSLWRSRRALAALTPEQRADAGISATDAQAEARRPLWDVPTSWRC